MSMRRWLLALLVLGGALLLYLPIKTPLNIYDEGLALVNAMRVGQGEMPFRDYWAIYPPGQSYALAAVFHLTNPTILTERFYDSLIRLICAVAIFLVATQMLGPGSWATIGAMLIYGVVVGLLAAATFYGYAMFPALLFAFLALLLFFHYCAVQHKRWLLSAGLVTGLTSLFRIDVAAYVGIAIVLSLLLLHLVGIPREGHGTPLQAWLGAGLRVVGGAVAVFLPFYGYLALAGNAGEMGKNLLVFPSTTFHEVRHLPYPAWLPDWARWQERSGWLTQVDWVLGEWLRFYLPLLIYSLVALMLVVAIIRALRKRETLQPGNVQAFALLLLGLGLFVQALSRYDAIHALPTTLPAVLCVGWLWRRLVTAPWWQPLLTPLPLLFTLIPLFVYGYIPYAKLNQLVEHFPPTRCYTTLPRAACIPISAEQSAMIEYLDQVDQGQGALFVGVTTHDRIFINDVSFYFLANRPIATRYHELHPGVATTLPVQQAIAEDLESKKTPWLVLADWGNPNEPNDSALSSGVTHLDEYIRSHYTFTKQFGNYQLWQRQGST